MPTQVLTAAERARLDGFPSDISESDLVTYFTLTAEDLALIQQRKKSSNRLGMSLQLCTLRWLGFVPTDLGAAPASAVSYLIGQLDVSDGALDDYAGRDQTRTDHHAQVIKALGFSSPNTARLEKLGDWLLKRALEHDKPTLLLQLACERLRTERIVRPGLTVLERLVARTRKRAEEQTHRHLCPLLTPDCVTALDALLVQDPNIGRTRLAWLRTHAHSATPGAISNEIDKLVFVRELGAETWDLSGLTPNRIKFLAQLARRSTNQALQRAPARRRYPILLAFCAKAAVELNDELVDLFDLALASDHTKARRTLDEIKRASSTAANEKVVLFSQMARILLDPKVPDKDVRAAVYARIPRGDLTVAMADAEELVRPVDDHYFDVLARRYSQVRRYAPGVVAALTLHANAGGTKILEALKLLQELNENRRRRVPDDAPTGFVPGRWRSYVFDDQGHINRRHWELCLLSELRGALRAGNVWVAGSRRYANPETYLIERQRWPDLRDEVCKMLGASSDGEKRLQTCKTQIIERLERLETVLDNGEDGVRIEDDKLVVRRLRAEEFPKDVSNLGARIAQRLPRIELSELLIEVDRWCGFTRKIHHAGGATPRAKDHNIHIYAAILAHACNFGLQTMADAADLSYRQLAWTTEWYLREETLKAAMVSIVNYHHRLPMAQKWGGGTLSSSDGQRFPVAVRSTTARPLPRYFGFGRGLTFYSWTSDQFSQYGTKVIPATMRDATYVLDAILDNETELGIVEHTTDTAGYTDLVFALFDLLGMQFSPRIRDLGDQRLYRLGPVQDVPKAGALLKGTINRRRIVEHWDDLLRAAGSLKLGWVTASLLISRLQAQPRKNALTLALQEYGRVIKTLFVLRYLQSEEYRRLIGRQLNKGEGLHSLRRFLSLANQGTIRRRTLEEQTDQAGCLNLVTNAVITWNTVYMTAALNELRSEGHQVNDEMLSHLSPVLFEHINPYGKYQFDAERILGQTQLRPLRRPTEGS